MIDSWPDDDRRRWRRWQVVLAYAILAALALGSLWLVDRKVHLLPALEDRNANSSATAPIDK
jgi:hypothetical protein